ncbi:S8 family peptidase [Longimicrobium terrae]|uniref:S8 family peptidase n=1 Tax=Longimicrobium terrae TaxID=1639882 RepID=UPI003B84866B
MVDDPDGWADSYEPARRVHGTAMASLILHGDLESPEPPLGRPLYTRPIMRPDRRGWYNAGECIPEDVLPLDLFHRAVRRLYEKDGDLAGAAPSVRVISVSIGDRSRQFALTMSSWARLLDYLAWKYQILFIVSAGNHASEIVLDVPRRDFDALRGDPQRLESEVLKAIVSGGWNRRLLSPAEALNALTVGAVHDDVAPVPAVAHRTNPYVTAGLPSPFNATGPGFRRSMKPEVLFAGGRQLYKEKPGNTHADCTLVIDQAILAPGHKVATPGRRPGDVTATIYMRGTSNATALAARTAGLIHDVLDSLREDTPEQGLEDRFTAVLLKALLVHGARWGASADALRRSLGTDKDLLARLLGYGRPDPTRVFECTDFRGTLIGASMIGDGQAHRYSVPLLPSLSGRAEWRALTVTLAWLSPVNHKHRAYRGASLWFEPYGAVRGDGAYDEMLSLARTDAPWQSVRRGTLQHEVFDGAQATGFVDGDELKIQVNCAAEAGRLDVPVPYAIAVTLEVAPEVQIPIYQEIRDRIRARVAVGVRTT